jgi:hypothetical protein
MKRNILKIENLSDPFVKIKLEKFEDKTLGELIKLLTEFTGNH